ncbi:hypothetical protein Ddc_12337 [Ditylenchus destructor]|nr:hypothetical protein Ddc_12337 [Ditylenchus destructor]
MRTLAPQLKEFLTGISSPGGDECFVLNYFEQIRKADFPISICFLRNFVLGSEIRYLDNGGEWGVLDLGQEATVVLKWLGLWIFGMFKVYSYSASGLV